MYSEFFLPPPNAIALKILAAAGIPPEPVWACGGALVELKASRR
jgi:hypothetical protein